MIFTKVELDALKQRVSQAYHLGYNIANPSEYVERLGGGAAPEGIEPFSTAHVLHLIELYEANLNANTEVLKVAGLSAMYESNMVLYTPAVGNVADEVTDMSAVIDLNNPPETGVTLTSEEAPVEPAPLVEETVVEEALVEPVPTKKSKKK